MTESKLILENNYLKLEIDKLNEIIFKQKFLSTELKLDMDLNTLFNMNIDNYKTDEIEYNDNEENSNRIFKTIEELNEEMDILNTNNDDIKYNNITFKTKK